MSNCRSMVLRNKILKNIPINRTTINETKKKREGGELPSIFHLVPKVPLGTHHREAMLPLRSQSEIGNERISGEKLEIVEHYFSATNCPSRSQSPFGNERISGEKLEIVEHHFSATNCPSRSQSPFGNEEYPRAIFRRPAL